MIDWIKKVYRQPFKYSIDESHKFDWHKKEREQAEKEQQEMIDGFRQRAGIIGGDE